MKQLKLKLLDLIAPCRRYALFLPEKKTMTRSCGCTRPIRSFRAARMAGPVASPSTRTREVRLEKALFCLADRAEAMLRASLLATPSFRSKAASW